VNRYEGVLLCNKPHGISSHGVIDIVRKTVGMRKIGHTGTLDPLATGLLVLCLGRATKVVQFLSGMEKTYDAEVTLGLRSSTFDSEGIRYDDSLRPVPPMTRESVEDILKDFRGRIRQKVPQFSAVKVDGRRLYELARKGAEVTPPEKVVEVREIKLKEFNSPRLRLEITCGSGTYIRSIANDIGEKIGCGAYLSALCRTRVGAFCIEDALTPEEVRSLNESGSLGEHIRKVENVLPFPSVTVDRDFAARIITGRSPQTQDIIGISGEFRADDLICLRNLEGEIMAVGRSDLASSQLKEIGDRSFFKYIRVLN
jgi:tRNA pseudouridine55 synthase